MDRNEATEQPLTILLVEDDKEACNELKYYIDTLDDVRLAAITDSSSTALDMVKYYLPDAVILDLELHHGSGNGLLFLQELKQTELPLHPYILVTTNNSSFITYEAARKLGADFIMSKHESTYSVQSVVEFLRMIHNTLLTIKPKNTSHSFETQSPDTKQRKLSQRLCREFDFVGISRKNIGYQYLMEAILLTLEQPQANYISAIAQNHHKSDDSVVHAMQNAINRAWRRTSIEDLEVHYTAKTHSGRGVPTIMEFVFYYVGLLQT